MGSTDSIESKLSESASKPSTPIGEYPAIPIQGRIGMAMFLIVGFLLGMIVLMDLLVVIFR